MKDEVTAAIVVMTPVATRVLAQTEVISGKEGWVGAGLLGMVLAWLLLKHLPDKDKLVKDLVNDFKAEAAAERKQCADQFATQNASLVGLTSALTAERAAIVASVNQHTTEAMGDYRHDLVDTINKAVLGKELYLAQKAAEKAQREHSPGPQP